MKFTHINIGEDGGGDMNVTAETDAETIEIIQHFRVLKLDTVEGAKQLVEAINSPCYCYTAKSDKRKWYHCKSALDVDSTRPYKELLERITGFETSNLIPDTDLTHLHPRRLCHTHITDRLFVDKEHICYECFDESEEWMGEAAAARADKNTYDYVKEDFGFRRFEREYKACGNGMYTPNPDYARKRHAASPGLGAPWFWKWLFTWWRENHATQAQHRVLAAVDKMHTDKRYSADWELRESGDEQCGLSSYNMYYDDPTGTIDWDGKGRKVSCLNWEDFKKL